MKMRICSIVLVLFLASVASALQTTFVFGKGIVGLDVEVQRFGPISINGVVAVDYFRVASSGDGDLTVVNDNYAGPSIKIHTLGKDSRIDPYIGLSYLIQNARVDDEFKVWEAGVDVFVNDKVGIGLAYITCKKFYRDDILMVRAPIRW